MSQFGKNPPWARDVGPISQTPGIALNQPPLGLVPQVFSQSAVPTPTVFSIQPGIALPTTLASSQVATVSYPSAAPITSQLQQKQRVFTGTVSKLHENFGFVDEDVFFQMSCVKGPPPKIGDRVLVEAMYNASMPFKWNATRIQVLTSLVQQPSNVPPASQTYQGMVAQPAYHSMAPASQAAAVFHSGSFKVTSSGSSVIQNVVQAPPPLMSKQTQPLLGRGLNLPMSSRRTDSNVFRERTDRARERATSRERRERRSPRKRSRSPRRSRSPKRSRSPRSPTSRTKSPQRQRRPMRVSPRYTVQIPKISLDLKEANLGTLRSRYTNLYIPSDFFSAFYLWVDVFPAHRPFPLGNGCDFHILPKSIDHPVKLDTPPDPSDVDYKFSVKVMLLTCPMLNDLYHKSCALADDPSDVKDSYQHPTRLIQFLVGLKGKSEPMAIGGPWSPSLDGLNPEGDPRVLINTAIRTTKAYTGIDLSRCTRWYRFTEIRYYRPEEVRKGRTVPAHVETVVIFLPDVWTCRPTSLEWQTLLAEYKKLLDVRLSSEDLAKAEPKLQEDEVEVEKEIVSDKKDPTHHSELDPKTMKLTDLRQELECRNLSSKGLKSQLIARLTKTLRSEEEKEAEETENKFTEEDENKEEDEAGKMDVDDEGKKLEEDDKQRQKERERAAVIRQYTLPDNPAILVRPSATAKGGKFECAVMSLSLLLDYRLEDNKEHVFEVSLFAEMFNEMLMRDFGFRIYKHLSSTPDNVEDEKKDKLKDDERKEKAKTRDTERKDSLKAQDSSGDADVVRKDVAGLGRQGTKASSVKAENLDASKAKDEHQGLRTPNDGNDDTLCQRERSGATVIVRAESGKRDTLHQPSTDGSSADPVKIKAETEEFQTTEATDDIRKGDLESTIDNRPKIDTEDDCRRPDLRDDDRDEMKDEKEKNCRALEKHDRSRFITTKPDLLLAFVYFDQSHAGYLLDKDIEEILYTLGLQLSRAQVKKLVSKLASRDVLNYRKLTDVTECERTASAAETRDGPLSADDESLVLGNRHFAKLGESRVDASSVMASKRPRLESEAVSSCDGRASSDAVVMHNGAFVDIDSILQNLNKSEKSRVNTETKLKELQQEHENVRTSHASVELANQALSSEVHELKKKLKEQRRAFEHADSSMKKYRDLLLCTRSTMLTLAADIKDATIPEKDIKTAIKLETTD